MSTKIRSTQGCWTCRLRRKKCDETRPTCQGCTVLEITCHFGDSRPEWMDGGQRQKEMALELKRQVRIRANQRRERKYLQSFEVAASALDDFELASQQQQPQHEEAPDPSPVPVSDSSDSSDHHLSSSTAQRSNASSSVPSDSGSSTASVSATATTQDGNASSDCSSAVRRVDAVTSGMAEMTIPAPHRPSGPVCHKPANLLAAWMPPSSASDDVPRELDDESDSNLAMVYLDHVFPFVFPFYKPSLLEGGRGWLLSLLRSHRAVYHTALSLSSYFFGVVLEADEGSPTTCVVRARQLLQERHSLALRELQADMAAINNAADGVEGVGGRLREAIRVLNSIIQLLVFDGAVDHSTNAIIHVDAALSLFRHIIPQPHLWTARIAKIGFDETVTPPDRLRPWSLDQAALRTFGAALFLIDVLTATSAGRRPLLQQWHASALDLDQSRDSDMPKRPTIRLEDYFGCQSWVVHLVGEVAVLDAWKKEARRDGSLCAIQLLARAVGIERIIRDGIACLDGQCPPEAAYGRQGHSSAPHPLHPSSAAPTNSSDKRRVWPRRSPDADDHHLVVVHTKVWAYAALAYLAVVVSGWRPTCPEIATNVEAAIDLLRGGDRGTLCLRALTWPFCVVGCLAPPQYHDFFRSIVCNMDPLSQFGSIKTAMIVLDAVWARSDILDEDWDIAACLQIMGYPVVLI